MQNKSDPLEETLAEINRSGISVDRQQLRNNICRQFPDYRLWIREYIVNAYDANAKNCHITGMTEGDVITISVRDDGDGMDRNLVESFLTKFRSIKQNLQKSVGQFGIGSFSVAAIPGQCAFSMLTSNGEETWRFTTGCMLDDNAIRVERITPVRPRGTTFDISFKDPDVCLEDEMQKLSSLARMYLYHLPIQVYFHREMEPKLPGMELPKWTPGNWINMPSESFPKRFCIPIGGHTFDIILAVGETCHYLYQKRVLISGSQPGYNLLEYVPLAHADKIPFLSIRVDSDAFKMPLGRHCLSNIEVLFPLARELRKWILPEYIQDLLTVYSDGTSEEEDLPLGTLEGLFCGYIDNLQNREDKVMDLPLFRTFDGKRLTFNDLKKVVNKKHQNIYFEDSTSGLDYTVFDGPVLSSKQPMGGLDLISNYFADQVVNLSIKNLIHEASSSVAGSLSSSEKRFVGCLGFHPESIKKVSIKSEAEPPSGSSRPKPSPNPFQQQISSTARKAALRLEDLKWRVSYLVARDGKTPAVQVMYVVKGNTVTLNLNHPEIRKLVSLSESYPMLAAHFAMAECLSTTGKNTILPRLPAEDRDDLINLDAVQRCGAGLPPPESSENVSGLRPEQQRDFNLNNREDDLPF